MEFKIIKLINNLLNLSRGIKTLIAISVDFSCCILSVWFSYYLRLGCLELPEGTYCNDTSNIKTEIQCPLCRTENNVKDDILDIKGSTEECKICFTNNVQKFFSKCGHACICDTCLDVLVKGD